jgi:hypothetical protein
MDEIEREAPCRREDRRFPHPAAHAPCSAICSGADFGKILAYVSGWHKHDAAILARAVNNEPRSFASQNWRNVNGLNVRATL